MKLTFLLCWLCAPVVWAAWHFGPGQEAIKRDQSDKALATARQAVAVKDFAVAIEGYDAALAALPKEEVAQARRIRLARVKAQIDNHQLPDAHRDLQSLYQELSEDPKAEPGVMNGVREALAEAMYYNTWLMRLEGQTREVWEPEIEGARQHFRHLAEQGSRVMTAADQKRCQVSLESAIKLARMDLAELQGLPAAFSMQGLLLPLQQTGQEAWPEEAPGFPLCRLRPARRRRRELTSSGTTFFLPVFRRGGTAAAPVFLYPSPLLLTYDPHGFSRHSRSIVIEHSFRCSNHPRHHSG